ncbi:MAG TPA: carbamoyltransferase HypF, partial [Gammaproteobacteria bacterium]|nr:carbamoyltransferase HypF [Gammaproteobacteria bacterium]
MPSSRRCAVAGDQARELLVGGQVQGVGFRPFVFRLAHELGLTGWVRNEVGRVRIRLQGPAAALDGFEARVLQDAPAIARPRLLASRTAPTGKPGDFRIEPSAAGPDADIHVPPDYFTCPDCLREMNDPADRRYRYPFINCTQCGPRYTLIRALPYDRPNTTMADFELCPDCAREYRNPLDRRFHAQPVACPACGPHLIFLRPGTEAIDDTPAALDACVDALRSGAVVAVKGIGGYHLLCDAADEAAVARLRSRKRRPHKPLAVMVPARGEDGLAAVRELAEPDGTAEGLLASPMRPIVLVPLRAHAPLAPSIAPGLSEVGLMLPYSPLHHLLLDGFGGPLVATSGNVSGEPVLTDADAAEQRLARVADAFLHHNRPIQRPADDAVFRPIAGRARPLRLGRGAAPLELELPFELDRPLLAVGGHMKATVTLAWKRRAVVSPHIGDLGTPRSMAVFEQVIADLQDLYGVRAERIACDAHPGYQSSRW